MEPLNKGHLCTDGFVPYSEVVLYWEVFINSHVLLMIVLVLYNSMIMA